MNIENAKRISEAMIKPQKHKQLNNALSLNGLYEIIKNIFTFGGVTREKSGYYNEFYSKLRENIITQDVTHRLHIPDEFSIQINKFTVYFSKENSGSQHTSKDGGKIIIKIVSPDKILPMEIHIDTITFKKACTTLLIREMSNNTHKNESLLTEQNKMNFRDHVFKGFEFPGMILCASYFENTQFENCDFKDVDLKNLRFTNSHINDFKFVKSRAIELTHTGITDVMEEITTFEEQYINSIEFKNCNFHDACFIIPYDNEPKTSPAHSPMPIKKTISSPLLSSPAGKHHSATMPVIAEAERSSSLVDSLVSDLEY